MAPPFASTHYRPNRAETPDAASLAPADSSRAPSLFRTRVAAVDLGLQNIGRLEHHHPARKDRHFDAGLRIAPHPLALRAHHERAESRQLDGLAARGRIADFVKNRLNQLGRFGSRQSDLLIDDFRQVGPRDRLSRFPPKFSFAAKPSVRHIEPQTIPASRETPIPGPAQGPKERGRLCRIRLGLSFRSPQVHKRAA